MNLASCNNNNVMSTACRFLSLFVFLSFCYFLPRRREGTWGNRIIDVSNVVIGKHRFQYVPSQYVKHPTPSVHIISLINPAYNTECYNGFIRTHTYAVFHRRIIIIIISAHKSDLSYPWSQTQASLSIPSLHPKNTNKRREREEKNNRRENLPRSDRRGREKRIRKRITARIIALILPLIHFFLLFFCWTKSQPPPPPSAPPTVASCFVFSILS